MDSMDGFYLHHHGQDVGKPQPSPETSDDLIRELEAKVDRLTVVCRGMWELLRKSSGLTEAELVVQVHELAGTADGRMKPEAKVCPHCSRPNKASKRKCIYCEKEIPLDSAFDIL